MYFRTARGHDFAFIAVLSIADEIAIMCKSCRASAQEHAVEHLNFRPSQRAIMVETKSPDRRN